jgi:hypothetical protein
MCRQTLVSGVDLSRRIPLSKREITLLHREVFGFREHDRRSEVSAEAELLFPFQVSEAHSVTCPLPWEVREA